jgi:general secretion pathway protein K
MAAQKTSERGMVLLLVLLVIVLLSTLLIEFSFSTLVDLRLAETFRDTARATYLARGGVHVGQALRQEDDNGYDALDEAWAQGVPGYPVADGTVDIAMEDLSGRIDLNRLVSSQGNIDVPVRDRYRRLLVGFGVDQPDALIATLIDWLDADSDLEPEGEEGGRYAAASPPYRCKNGPLDTIDELLLVQGYDSALLARLRRHVTAYGSERINVNTASREVLMALADEMTEPVVEAILAARQKQPFTRIEALKTLPGMETLYGFIYLYLDVRSDRFRIMATGTVNDGRRQIEAIVTRAGDRVLYQRVL